MVTLNPYLNFADATAREAMEFYASVLGGELNVMTFGDMGTEGPMATQVMHGQLETPSGLTLMGADAPPEMVQVTFGDNVSVSLSGGQRGRRVLAAGSPRLSEGGHVRQPLEAAPWGDEFGMFVDRSGSTGSSTSPAPRPDACPTSLPGGPTPRPRPRASTRAPSAPTGFGSGPTTRSPASRSCCSSCRRSSSSRSPGSST